MAFALHGFQTLPFWLAMAGVATAYVLYIQAPHIPAQIARRFSAIHKLLDEKYYFDRFNEVVFAGGARWLGNLAWTKVDAGFIDGSLVNGSANLVGQISGIVRHLQTGVLYHYAFAMIIGLLVLLGWIVHGG